MIDGFLLFYFFILGTLFGSFLNVIVDRLPKGESIITGRSYCDSCKKKILWYDLIPLVSYVLLSGKCRYCKKPIGVYYPLVELTTAILFVLTAVHARGSYELIYLLLVLSTLIVIFFTDLKYGIIPFAVVFPGIVIAFLYTIFFTTTLFSPALFSAVGAFLFFFLIFFFTKGKGMGFGDVVYAFYMGFLLSFPGIIFGLYLGFLTGATISLILVLTGKKKLKGDTIPFGPFLVFGTVFVLLYADQILQMTRQFIPIF